jgi:CubicO group peptidase (beta-lactamase class C family)
MVQHESVQPEDVGLSSARLAKIGPWMQRLVDDKKLPGVSVAVLRRGGLAYFSATGFADIARAVPWTRETLLRIYSMTKPLTSTAIMMLYEEGRFQLDDPIARFLPAFANMRVFVAGSRAKPETVPAERGITFRDLLTHTSGLTYAFMDATAVDAMYRDAGLDFQTSELSLAELVDKAAALPLLAQPGAEWNYSIATDVLGRLVEVISAQPFDSFLRERVFAPLGMRDTGFRVANEMLPRFAALYTRGPDGTPTLIDDVPTSIFRKPRLPSGGGGLVSTLDDYLRFCRFLLNKGELDGVRLLGRKTVELMTANHLPGDLAAMGQARFSESPYTGIGFGLGFSVMLDPARAQILGTPGEYAWGGAASTAFWIDPAEDMAVLMMTQLLPSSAYPIRRELRVLTYQAVID